MRTISALLFPEMDAAGFVSIATAIATSAIFPLGMAGEGGERGLSGFSSSLSLHTFFNTLLVPILGTGSDPFWGPAQPQFGDRHLSPSCPHFGDRSSVSTC